MKRSDLLPLIALLALSSCGEGLPDSAASATTCPANAAMISVGDGYLETLCGCAEASPVYTSAGARLTCTVTAGSTIFVHYLATTLKHQIVPTTATAFPASPVSDPIEPERMIRVHAFRLDAPGTYSFKDQFNAALVGDLIVL